MKYIEILSHLKAELAVRMLNQKAIPLPRPDLAEEWRFTNLKTD